jgi:thiamine-phosphate pyrophosphorylase
MAEVKQRCRLYFQAPAQVSAKIETQLARVIASTDAACVLLSVDDETLDETHAGRLIDLVQARGLACLVENDIALAERLGVDGVHIAADPALYAESRRRLGESASIGAGCGPNRHAAMQLAEMGADYVAFGPDGGDIDAINQRAELIAWWAEIFVVPCVAWHVDSAEEAARLAALGADFVAPSSRIWHDDDATKLIADIDSAIRQARRSA